MVAASELIDGDSAAATIAAMMNPEMPCGNEVTTKRGRTSSVASERPRQRRVLIERVEHHADQQEQRELREDDEAAQNESG